MSEHRFTLYRDPLEGNWALRRRANGSFGMWTVLSWHSSESDATKECIKVSGKPPEKVYR